MEHTVILKKVFTKATQGKFNQTAIFGGLNLSLQLNKTLLSFIIEDLKTKAYQSTPLWGGQHTIKATIVGDFLKFKNQ